MVALDPPLDGGVDAANLKPILRVIDETPLVPPPSIALARWVAEYYAAGPGETLALTLPPAARGRDHAFKTTRIAELERQIGSWQRRESECQRITAIPGVGRLTASAVVATVADARTFRSGREFAAFLGLVPRQAGTGGRVKLLGISKRGDPYLRTLLIHGARAVLRQQSRTDRTLDPWLKELLARRPKNVAIVALANKMARTIWALLAHGRAFDRSWSRAAMPIPAALH